MALIPYAFRPRIILRRNAVRKGLLGPSTLWKVIAAVVFGKSTLKKIFGRQPEKLATVKLKPDQFVNVIVAKPLGKKERKRTGITKDVLREQARADVRRARRAS